MVLGGDHQEMFKAGKPINVKKKKKAVGNNVACRRPPVEHGLWKTNPRLSVHLAILSVLETPVLYSQLGSSFFRVFSASFAHQLAFTH